MEQKVIVVTGASSGLGKALTVQFAKDGHLCCALARGNAGLEVVANTHHRNIHPYPVDVSDAGQVEATFKRIIEQHGRVDALINCAGVFHGPGEVTNQSIDSIDNIIDTNLKGTMYCTYSVVASMSHIGGGNIINISSVAGLPGYGGHIVATPPTPTPFFGDYGTSKWGVIGFGESMTETLKRHKISLTTICPGGMASTKRYESQDPSNIQEAYIPIEEMVELAAYILSRPRGSISFRSIVVTPGQA